MNLLSGFSHYFFFQNFFRYISVLISLYLISWFNIRGYSLVFRHRFTTCLNIADIILGMDARVELEGSNKDKFEELQEFLEERTNNEKYGKANTLRLAVQLGHQKMEELKQDRKEKVEEFKEYERKIEKAVEEL